MKERLHNIEQTILRNILSDEKYMRKVLPFIKPDYFQGVYKLLFSQLALFVGDYNKLPTQEALVIEVCLLYTSPSPRDRG